MPLQDLFPIRRRACWLRRECPRVAPLLPSGCRQIPSSCPWPWEKSPRLPRMAMWVDLPAALGDLGDPFGAMAASLLW